MGYGFFKNPVVYSFAIAAAILLLISVFVGIPLTQTLQLIFVPYTYDITYGVGAEGAKIFAVALVVSQLALIALTTLGVRLDHAAARRFVWGTGVVVVAVYFAAIVLGYLINNFH